MNEARGKTYLLDGPVSSLRMKKNEIPLPFQFNSMKHHLPTIMAFIRQYPDDKLTHLKKDLSIIGESQMDLYTGNLAIESITNQLSQQLNLMGRLSRLVLFEHLEKEDDYISLPISDESKWVIRLSWEVDRYIHLHPARYSSHTTRIKASTLKTFIAVCIYSGKIKPDLDEINRVRTSYLGLSPVRSVSQASGLGKVIRQLAG